MTRHAVALRAFSHADDDFAADQVILDMAANQFADWEQVHLVREATEEEVAAARKRRATSKAPARSRA